MGDKIDLERAKEIIKGLIEMEQESRKIALEVLPYAGMVIGETVDLLVWEIKDLRRKIQQLETQLKCDHDWQLMTPEAEYCHKCGGKR